MPVPSDSDPRLDDPRLDDAVFEDNSYEANERMTDQAHGDDDYADRTETLIRILYTLLFFLVMRVVEAALGVVVFFQLIFALVTNSQPNPAVNAFARRMDSRAESPNNFRNVRLVAL